MNRRQLLQHTALATAAFAFSRDSFARMMYPADMDRYTADIIRLGSNENPHGPSPAARKAMMDTVADSNRYPWDMTAKLQEKLGAHFGLTAKHVIIGAGSSELLGVAATWAALKKGNAVAPDPTFRLWIPAASRLGIDIRMVPLDNKKVTDLQQLLDKADSGTRMIYVCNPANPTGTIVPAAQLREFIKRVPASCMILLDEAYTEFSSEPSMANMVDAHPNLVIAKTFSKAYGMAGARVGYALAHPDTIKELNSLQPWANAGASAVSLAGAIASIDDQKFVAYCVNENKKAKAILYAALEKAGMPYIPSSTSFVYFDTKPFGKDVRTLLESKNIFGTRIFEENTGWRRLSIGTVKEMEEVAKVLG
ncbi:MAG: aminotransferase class I/II-fold pyridoxal phosphate-dependent enzyme [Chitinophagaceae bacterium]|nr:aminotransferase class I/II-fold pyridoxal phosphate-dependent enzyme [Chitinophagaceae bacterium]